MFLIFNVAVVSAQLQHFDSSFSIAQHPGYDYLNPDFEKMFNSNYFETDYFTLVYEKRNKLHSQSDIVFRKVLYENLEDEVTIVSDGFMNTEPSAGHSIIAWQSDKNGNQDIFYSTYNGTIWSAPLLLQGDAVDDLFPDVEEIRISGFNPCYLILFQRDGDIILNQIFENNILLDTNLTAYVSEFCSEPKIKFHADIGFQDNIYISYLKNVNGINRINLINAGINLQYEINFGSSVEIIQEKSPLNLNISNGAIGREILHYDYDTAGSVKNVGIFLDNVSERIIINNEHGNNTGGRGASLMQSNYHPVFNAFGWLKKINDSARIVATDFRLEYGVRKEFYIGDSTMNSRLAMSSYFPKLVYNRYRYRLVWEQESGGRTALKMSVYDEGIAGLHNTDESPEKFTLYQNFPNPFNPSTAIRFFLPESKSIVLEIYDIRGSKKAELTRGRLRYGEHILLWNASDFPAGIYFYRLKTDDFIQTRRMVLIK